MFESEVERAVASAETKVHLKSGRSPQTKAHLAVLLKLCSEGHLMAALHGCLLDCHFGWNAAHRSNAAPTKLPENAPAADRRRRLDEFRRDEDRHSEKYRTTQATRN